MAVLPRAFGEGPAVRNPLSPVPALVARPRAFGESTIRPGMPDALVVAIDRMDAAGRRRTHKAIGGAAEASGFAAACERRSVVITTNLAFSRWGAVFGDDQMAAAVIGRMVHQGRLLQFRGESYRVRHALMQG